MNKDLLKIKKQSKEIKDTKTKLSTKLSYLRLISFLVFLITIFISVSTTNYILLSISIIILIIFIVIIINHEKIIKDINKQEFYISTITKYENRCNDKWKEEPNDNIENLPDYINDLDIINGNSLLKYLNFTNTLGSKKLLIDSLIIKNKPNKKDIHLNQESIQELSKKYKFILEFQYLLNNIDNIKETDYKEYLYFFNNKKHSNKIELIISIILSITTIIVSLLSIFKILPIYYFLVLTFIQLIYSHIYKIRYNDQLSTIDKCSKKYSTLTKTYNFISKETFTSKKLTSLQENISKGEKILKEITKISSLNNLRFNFITEFIFTIFASLNFIIISKYNKLLTDKLDSFKESINSLEELDKLISLSTIGIIKNNITFPTIEDNLSIKVDTIKHPLLNENTCIPNNFSCQKDINIITGSNMSGKTSFMKTIATNLILAYNGTYVNASYFKCPIANIFTSINVKDDISKGISTFYGELKRIKEILDFSKKSNNKLIIFIDEIFKGTNYNDRILGAKETLKQLVELNCIVFLTTHDFELCEISNKQIKNYHFSESYQDNKIYFDYKIKEGKCKTTNAKYLMEQMGIIK